jgi:hypothetical protein
MSEKFVSKGVYVNEGGLDVSRSFLTQKLLENCVCCYALSQNCGKLLLLASSCLSVSMEQLGFPWTDFHEILYLNIFLKIVEKIQVSLKSDKYNRRGI